MGAPIGGNGTDSVSARIIGSGTAGVLELVLFHPVDTIAKRLMNNKEAITSNFNKVIFKDAADKGLVAKYKSLFPGIGFAAGYKIAQRVYKFGGQPIATDFLTRNYSKEFQFVFGDRSKMIMHATAGSLIGIGEIALLPLDILKIKMQTNPELLKGKNLFSIISQEGFRGLYKGAGWTAARNAPGSFALFGGAAFTKEKIFGLKDYRDATFFQNFCASIAGAVASITVSAPLDVVKTRIQAARFDSTEKGLTIVSNMVKKEGLGSFFKGLTPKILVVGPKLIFSFTVAQQLIPLISNYMEK